MEKAGSDSRAANATTPELLRWFQKYNDRKAYTDQVRPFGFMLAAQADADVLGRETKQGRFKVPKPVAPFATDEDALEPFMQTGGGSGRKTTRASRRGIPCGKVRAAVAAPSQEGRSATFSQACWKAERPHVIHR